MKNYIVITIIIALISMTACNNQEWEFDDFDYTTSYFPYQSPVRTLVLDETYYFDNSNDMQLKFLIGAAMGGVYENDRDIVVEFEVDESLTEGLIDKETGEPVLPLPQNYYTLSNDNTLIIPAGTDRGHVEVQLTEEFLNDSASTGLTYVIPLKITYAQTDSVLSGKPAVENGDIRVAEDWEIAPKNYTLFGVKYVNKYHGTYLLRGQSVVSDKTTDEVVDEITYRQHYVEWDEIVNLNTNYKKSVVYQNSVRLSDGSPGSFKMVIQFDDNDSAVITEAENSDFPVTGSAKFEVDGDEWGGKKRNAIYLDYEVDDGTYVHAVKDTLVFRDKGVAFEEFKIGLED